MDLTRLRALRELSKRKTMVAVSEALFLSASAVSQQIAQLEDEVGIKLVERRGRGVYLTVAGERLVTHAERIIEILEEAKTDLAELKKTIAGDLRIAAFPSVASSLIPRAMRIMEDLHPFLNIHVHAMEPNEGLSALRAWQTDIAIVDDMTVNARNVSNNVDQIYLCTDRLFAILPADHRFAAEEVITIAQLRDDRWALDLASNNYSNVITSLCREAGYEPVVNGTCNGFEVVVALIEAGCSVSVMPGLRVASYNGNAVVKPIVPTVERRIYAAMRKGEIRNPAIAAFLNVLKDIALVK